MKRSPKLDPVHEAVLMRSLPKVVEAIAQGADVNALDREGRTALFYAAKDGDVSIAAELIRHGADVNVKDKLEFTALHFAANAYQIEVAKLLIEHGANIDAQD